MRRQGVNPPVHSIRMPSDRPVDCPEDLAREVAYFPDPMRLAAEMRTLRMFGRYPWRIVARIRGWGKRPDKSRLLEAAWLGKRLKAAGIGHVHAHFSGIAARTAYWLKGFYGISYSFTGHANDMFCKANSPISLEDLVREASFVVAVSDFTRDWLAAGHPAHKAKIHRIYNGIDCGLFASHGARPEIPLIVSVGRYVEKKGFATLIDACAILRGRGVDFRCRVAGGGPLEETLRAQVVQRGLDGVVELVGPMPQEDVRALLAEASLFVLPCVREKGGGMDVLPTVVAEAMAAGLPVISTPVAGVPEMVEPSSSGLLVPERDTEQLAAAMSALLTNPELAGRLGCRGRELANEKFSVSSSVGSLLALLPK